MTKTYATSCKTGIRPTTINNYKTRQNIWSSSSDFGQRQWNSVIPWENRTIRVSHTVSQALCLEYFPTWGNNRGQIKKRGLSELKRLRSKFRATERPEIYRAGYQKGDISEEKLPQKTCIGLLLSLWLNKMFYMQTERVCNVWQKKIATAEL